MAHRRAVRDVRRQDHFYFGDGELEFGHRFAGDAEGEGVRAVGVAFLQRPDAPEEIPEGVGLGGGRGQAVIGNLGRLGVDGPGAVLLREREFFLDRHLAVGRIHLEHPAEAQAFFEWHLVRRPEEHGAGLAVFFEKPDPGMRDGQRVGHHHRMLQLERVQVRFRNQNGRAVRTAAEQFKPWLGRRVGGGHATCSGGARHDQ